MRVIFAGTPEFARVALERLLAAGFTVPLVLTQPDRPAGRGMKLQASPVKQCALEHGIAVAQPRSLRLDGKYPEEAAAARAAIEAAQADVMVVAAYGLILPQWVLDTPPRGCLNIHASLLPRWRGAAPIQRAIMAGDAETGVTIMRMEEGLDTGPMCLAGRGPIGATTTAGSLHDSLMYLGASLMVEALSKLEGDELECRSQPEVGVTYARKIDKAESEIDFSKPALEVRSHIHGLAPFPGAWFLLDQESRTFRIKVHLCEIVAGKGQPGEVIDDKLTIACGDGAVRLLSLQREGKSAMGTEEFLRGFSVPKGTVIG